jgi:putative ABC transport system permease protein
MSKTVDNQRTQIAVMQAIGISKAKLRFNYLSYAVICALLGSIVFALIGNLVLPAFLINSIMHRFTLPTIDVPIYTLYLLLPFALATLFSVAATLFAVQKVLKENPAQAMRPRPPKGQRQSGERVHWLWES